jgi:N-acetylglucosaminyldiphosphoundecaprenol N-acetyl-beta-D-mannosaminyltransferase
VIDGPKVSVLGVLVDTVDYEAAVERIICAAKEGRAHGVTALAVHGVMTGVDDPAHRTRLNRLNLVTPDGQPVRWAMNLLHHSRLHERVYGPTLALKVCRAAAAEGLPVYFYGTDDATLLLLRERLCQLIPGLVIAGTQASRFGRATRDELDLLVTDIRRTGARLCFVGLGCPRQEVFVYENMAQLSMPVLAVGAAFSYHAGLTQEPPAWIQRAGLQWLHRLIEDPKRLWRRYLILNPRYMIGVIRQWVRGAHTDPEFEPEFVGWA